MLTRRILLKRAATVSALAFGLPSFRSDGKIHAAKFRIGACDWSIGKRGDIAAFNVAKEIGLAGIQVSLGTDEDNMQLRQGERQRAYLKASEETGVAIASLAIGELNRVPYKSEPRTEQWVWDGVDVAHTLGVSVILLAFFDKNDLRGDDTGKREVVRRLREVALKAEKHNIILGIESYLSAEEHMDIIQRVGSSNVKVYYDFRNSADAGYDVIKELRFLGKDTICELHMKENGSLLGDGTMDWPRIAETLDDLGYYGDGWMQIEGARPPGADIITSYRHNLEFLKARFGL